MIRADRDRLIERYMNGQMTQGEEEAFFINAAVNPELRQELKAHRLVETAVRKDRDGLTTGHAALRNRVAATLTSATPTPVLEPMVPQAGMLMERVLGAMATHPAVTAIIVGIITIGTVILQPWESTENAPTDGATPAVHTAPSTALQPNGAVYPSIQSPTTTLPSATITQPVEVNNNARNEPAATTTTRHSANEKEATEQGQSNKPLRGSSSSASATTSAATSSTTPSAVAKPDSIEVGIFLDVKSPIKPQKP